MGLSFSQRSLSGWIREPGSRLVDPVAYVVDSLHERSRNRRLATAVEIELCLAAAPSPSKNKSALIGGQGPFTGYARYCLFNHGLQSRPYLLKIIVRFLKGARYRLFDDCRIVAASVCHGQCDEVCAPINRPSLGLVAPRPMLERNLRGMGRRRQLSVGLLRRRTAGRSPRCDDRQQGRASLQHCYVPRL